jgi:hypothetical protein
VSELGTYLFGLAAAAFGCWVGLLIPRRAAGRWVTADEDRAMRDAEPMEVYRALLEEDTKENNLSDAEWRALKQPSVTASDREWRRYDRNTRAASLSYEEKFAAGYWYCIDHLEELNA